MTTITLPFEKYVQIEAHLASLKVCPAISDVVSTNLHRSQRNIRALIEKVREEEENILDRHRKKAKDENPSIPEAELEFSKKSQVEIQKALHKLHRQDLHPVEVHLIKRSDLPAKKEDYGSRMIQQESKQGHITNTVCFYDHFLELLDVIILEDDEWQKATKKG